MDVTTPANGGRTPKQPITPPDQIIDATANENYSPSMSPGDSVTPRLVEDPFGIGPALPGSISVAHNISAIMHGSEEALRPEYKYSASDSDQEDKKPRKKIKTKKTCSDYPEFEKKNGKSPGGDDSGGNASTDGSSDTQGAAGTTHMAGNSDQQDIDMADAPADGGPQDEDDDFWMLETPTKQKPAPADADLAVPSIEPQDSKPSTKSRFKNLTYKPEFVSRDRSAPPAISLDRRGDTGLLSKIPSTAFNSVFDTVENGSEKRSGLLNRAKPITADIEPAPGSPIHTEIISYVRYWGLWSQNITDPAVRDKVLTWICDVLYKAWVQGIKHHLIPKRVPVGCENLSRDDLRVVLDSELAREKQASINKKLPDPAKTVMIEIKRLLSSDLRNPKLKLGRKPPIPTDYSITAGELSEAGVKWSNVDARVARDDLDENGSFMHRATAGFPNRSIVPSQHWAGKQPKSPNNPTGRDLKYYCLWEVCRCDAQIEELQNTLEMQKAEDEQGRAIYEAKIEAEQKLRDQLMAIALELDPKTKTVIVLDDDEDDEGEGEASSTPVGTQLKQGSVVSADSSQKGTPINDTPVPPPYTPVSRFQQAEVDVMSTKSKIPQAYFRERDYYREQIVPQANELLKASGQDPIESHIVGWNNISEALRSANVSVEKRNHLGMQINLFIQKLDSDLQKEDRVIDVPGYPTRSLIWQTIPPHGMTFTELALAFPETKPTDKTWQKLVKSVAEYRDKHWFPNLKGPDEEDVPPLPIGFRPSLPVRLNLKTAFDPEEYSSRTVNNTKGFKWRYVNTATITQRASMDEHIESYVAATIEADRVISQASGKPAPRNGRYEVLVNPNDLDGGAIVHGLWDANKGRQISNPDWQWFSNGDEKDMTFYQGYKSLTPLPVGSPEEIAAWHEERKVRLITSLQEQTKGAAQSLLALAQGKKPTAPATPKGKGKGKPSGIVSSGSSKTPKGKGIASIGFPSTPTKRGGKAIVDVRAGGSDKKRKIKQEQENSPRPKRTAGSTPRYADLDADGAEDGGDGDFEVQDGSYDDAF